MTEESNILTFETHLVQASHGKRFANYIVDIIVYMILAFILALLTFIIFPSLTNSIIEENTVTQLLFQITWMIVLACLIGAFETLTKGRSPGKYLTGTKVVNQDGTIISASTAFKRGFIRIIPFEIFSALGSPCFPWHDRWSRTYVIDIKDSTLPEG